MEDEKIIGLFFERSEDAIKELDVKYGRLFRSVAIKISGSPSDAEECVNDAYLGVWNVIPPAKPSLLCAFVCKIVRNTSLKRYKANTAAKRNGSYDVAIDELADCLAAPSCVEDEIAAAELTHVIEAFLDSQSKKNRVIFMRRYWFSDSYAEIAKRVGLTEKNISVRLTRIRKDLRDYLIRKKVF